MPPAKRVKPQIAALESRVGTLEANSDVLIEKVTDIDANVTVLVKEGLPAFAAALGALKAIQDGVEKIAAHLIVVNQHETRLKALEDAVFRAGGRQS